MFDKYFTGLYQRTMREAYRTAYHYILSSLVPGSVVLDCGANNGATFEVLSGMGNLASEQYHGVEWNPKCAAAGRKRGLDIVQGDLNIGIPYADSSFSCVYALSVLEHLLNPCRFLKECHRVLVDDGTLVLLTPNISTYFTAALILLGKMPSSGPHPDSNVLLSEEMVMRVSASDHAIDAEDDTPVHRHLVVFSFRVLRDYLRMVGFSVVRGHGFGLYPFPNFSQPLLEHLDPYHCHQMVFIARKQAGN